MQGLLKKLLEPQNVMWIVVVLVIIISKLGLGLNYISVTDV